ncbi:MAG: 4Fe-4S double cluster binding domain-containing protein [Clostridia bacterium]|nr:4Fe-4S double cluster binding domain-containing protein [Clostridia bacterium]
MKPEALRTALLGLGFSRVVLLDAAQCLSDGTTGTLVLALWTYPAQQRAEADRAWIHPYYIASQKAYMAAKAFAGEMAAQGVPIHQRDDIRVKPIFCRLPGFHQGRNTISYIDGVGSRFHVQIFLWDEVCTPDLVPEAEPHPLQCGECTRCYDVCPTGALDGEGFHREKCLRHWMMNGQVLPEPLRQAMGNRLIGCDSCQVHCPHNPPAEEAAQHTVDIRSVLADYKGQSMALRPVIGSNITIPNRVLAQMLIIAGNSGEDALLPLIAPYTAHPSPTVKEHALWAQKQLQKETAQIDE